MANIQGNTEALKRFFLTREKTDQKFGTLVDPVKFITLSGATLGYPMPYQLRTAEAGYEIHALREGSTPGTRVRVSFGVSRPLSGDGFLLQQGESIRCERGFRWVWISLPSGVENEQPIGVTRTLKLAITSDPFINLAEGRRHQVEYMATLGDLSDAVGVPVHQGELVSVHVVDNATTRLSAVADPIEIWWKMFDPYGLWAHNEADDFSATALGLAGPDHDIECYYAPAGAVQVAALCTTDSYGTYVHVRGDDYAHR